VKTRKQQMIESLKISITIASEMVDSLFIRFQNRKITTDEYYRLMEKWDDKLYNYRKELQYQKSL